MRLTIDVPVTAIAAVVATSVAFVMWRSIMLVPQNHAYVVERFGLFNRTLQPGLRLRLPLIDTIRAKIDVRERIHQYQPLEVMTKDRLLLHVDWAIYYQVTDPRTCVYGNIDLIEDMGKIVASSLRAMVREIELIDVLMHRRGIDQGLRRTIDVATGYWGVRVSLFSIGQITPTRKVSKLIERATLAKWEEDFRVINERFPGVIINHGIIATGNSQVSGVGVTSRTSITLESNVSEDIREGVVVVKENSGIDASGRAVVTGNAVASGGSEASVSVTGSLTGQANEVSLDDLRQLLEDLSGSLSSIEQLDDDEAEDIASAIDDAVQELARPEPRMGKLRIFARGLGTTLAGIASVADQVAKIDTAIRGL